MIARHYSDAPDVDFDNAPEMAPYREQPDAMYVGCPGKRGYLNLEFELGADGVTVLSGRDRRAPLIVQQALYFDERLPAMPCVYILSSGGPNVDGDRFSQRFTLGPGAMAHISTGAATKIAVMRRNYSGLSQHISLAADSYLEYLPEPVIPCRHARFISDTRVSAHPTATMTYGEIFTAGRKYYGGESMAFDLLSVATTASRPDGTELFREKFVIDPSRADLRLEGIMHSYDVMANVIVIAPPRVADSVYAATPAFIDRSRRLAVGVTRLPSQAGLLFKALGAEPGPVKAAVRDLASSVRLAVKGVPLPPEFPWR